jgi:hypothetical protein
MAPVSWRLALVGLTLFAGGETAYADNYADPSGFSFDYPAGWTPITRAFSENATRIMPETMRTWLANNKVDLSRIAVVLVRNGGDDFLENMNVIVDSQQIPVNEQTMKMAIEQVQQRCATTNMMIENIQGHVQKVGQHDAVVLDSQVRFPGVPQLLRQRQVMLPGGGKTFFVTCTSKAESYNTYQPTFEQILTSFQVPPPVAQPTGISGQSFDWKQVLIMGLVGGVIGGLFGTVKWITQKFSSKADRD